MQFQGRENLSSFLPERSTVRSSVERFQIFLGNLPNPQSMEMKAMLSTYTSTFI